MIKKLVIKNFSKIFAQSGHAIAVIAILTSVSDVEQISVFAVNSYIYAALISLLQFGLINILFESGGSSVRRVAIYFNVCLGLGIVLILIYAAIYLFHLFFVKSIDENYVMLIFFFSFIFYAFNEPWISLMFANLKLETLVIAEAYSGLISISILILMVYVFEINSAYSASMAYLIKNISISFYVYVIKGETLNVKFGYIRMLPGYLIKFKYLLFMSLLKLGQNGVDKLVISYFYDRNIIAIVFLMEKLVGRMANLFKSSFQTLILPIIHNLNSVKSSYAKKIINYNILTASAFCLFLYPIIYFSKQHFEIKINIDQSDYIIYSLFVISSTYTYALNDVLRKNGRHLELVLFTLIYSFVLLFAIYILSIYYPSGIFLAYLMPSILACWPSYVYYSKFL